MNDGDGPNSYTHNSKYQVFLDPPIFYFIFAKYYILLLFVVHGKMASNYKTMLLLKL